MIKTAMEVFLAREPESVITTKGTEIWKSSFAIQNKEKGGESVFVEILAFNGTAQGLKAAGLKKGELVYIEGSLQTETYQRQDGSSNTRLVLLVDRIARIVRPVVADKEPF